MGDETRAAGKSHIGGQVALHAATGAALGNGRARARATGTFGTHFGQATATGALPILYAATAPGVESGQFIGPSHAFQLFGPPRIVQPSKRARNLADARRLWESSEELTGQRYSLAAAN